MMQLREEQLLGLHQLNGQMQQFQQEQLQQVRRMFIHSLLMMLVQHGGAIYPYITLVNFLL